MRAIIPCPLVLWRSGRFWLWALCAWLGLKAAPAFIVDYWFLDSLGHAQVFTTNFTAQVLLFAMATALVALAVIVPIRRHAVSDGLRRAAVDLGLWAGLFCGWLLAGRYLEFLLAWQGGTFGQTDPVFGHDIGVYVFTLPAIRAVVMLLAIAGAAGSVAAVVARLDYISRADLDARHRGLWPTLTLLSTPTLNVFLTIVGGALATRTFLTRYDLLFRNNEASGVRVGAEYLDVTGLFSTLNLISVSTFVEVGFMVVAGSVLMRGARRADRILTGREAAGIVPPMRWRRAAGWSAALLALDLSFYLGVLIRDHVFVAPNEPGIQLPYIARHIDATMNGYRLDHVETIPWQPPAAPLRASSLTASRTVQNAPLLPTWVSHLEQPPDIQHYRRVETSKSTLVYGPMLQVYEQEQQLRPYYKFLSVDGVRYTVDGEKRMYASAVRELPSLALVGPKEWLRYWGSAALMYTHGFGLVMSPVNEINAQGGPVYSIRDVPPRASHPMFETEPRIYFGEGAKDDYILTNIRHLKEFDFATPQSRAEFVFPSDAPDGIAVDSVLKRLVLAAYTRDLTAFLFSTFIDHGQTRVHLHRSPLRRIRAIAPFLFLDSNAYAFIADGRTKWLVNGLTTTAHYPYAFREVLGDKADERAIEPFPERVINYGEDSTKITIDALSGDVRFYKIADDPIVDTWSRVYPGLFEPRSTMPPSVEAQLTYPLQWFHVQFDDIYKRYHQRHPLEFYNVEDLWDDADEVVGSIGRGLEEFGTTDEMTFSYEGHHMLIDPADLPEGAVADADGDLQFVMMMPFTPEGGRNLRSLVLAFQDPGRYGRLVNLRVPQGVFLPGPEQADSLIDADAQVNQQITLWVRHGAEVIRGHTLLVPVRGDLAYVEPLWIASLQNSLPQLKLVSVVYRGRTTMATSLREAIELLDVSESEEQKANELPWFREAGAR